MTMLPVLLAAGGACATGAVFSWASVAPSAQLFGPTVRRIKDASTVALTFDDGPNPAITPALLQLLDKHGVHATFFQIGKYVRFHPAIAREVTDRGHTIGNHT